jgi:hypothetical protein
MIYFIINCSGKSGSTTLNTSFMKIANSQHCHSLTDIETLGAGFLKKMKYKKSMLSFINEHLQDTFIFIDSYRNILDRKISAFFHHVCGMELQYLSFPSNKQILEKKYKKEGINFLINEFKKNYLFEKENYHSSLLWEKHFNYNIFDIPFKNDYQLYHKDNKYFVNLKFSNINNWENIIQNIDFNNNDINKIVRKFKINKTNITNSKWYGKMYNDFKNTIKLTDEEKYKLNNQFKNVIEHFNG